MKHPDYLQPSMCGCKRCEANRAGRRYDWKDGISMGIYKTGIVPATQTEEKTVTPSAATERPRPEFVKPRERNFIELEAPEQFKFETEGEQLEGYLLERNRQADGKVEYLIEKQNGDRVTFLETWDIGKKFQCMGAANILRHYVCITYVGEDQEIKPKEGQSRLRRFRFQVDPGDVYKAPNLATVTNSDIPF